MSTNPVPTNINGDFELAIRQLISDLVGGERTNSEMIYRWDQARGEDWVVTTRTTRTVAPTRKPPVGLIPKDLFHRNRSIEICKAIERYTNVGMEIPEAWIRELHEICIET